MKKSFGHRVLVVGLLASLIASPAWAMIMVTVKPAAGSSRKTTDPVQGHGTLMVMMDDVTNWNWKFGFGTKDPMTGMWQSEDERAFTPNPTSWGKLLPAKPWTVSQMSLPPMPPTPIPDHWCRVTQEWALNVLGPVYVHETDMHLVTN